MPRLFSKTPLKLPVSGVPTDAPPINTVPTTQTTPVGTAKVFSEANGNVVKVGDVDSPVVTATVSTTNGTIEVIPNPGTLIWFNKTARVSVTGSVVNVNRALNGMFLTPVAAYNGTATITLRTSDGYNVDYDTFDVTVGVGTPPAPAPSPPVNTVTGAKTTAYTTALNFAGLGVAVYDADTPNLTTTLSMTGGVAGVSTVGGATVQNNNTSIVTISGTQAQINAALNTLIYTPSAGFSGAGQISMTTSDGVLVDTDVIPITVQQSVNAPVNTLPASVTTARNTPYTFSGTISMYDPNPDNITVTLTVNNGTLKAVLSGSLPLADGYPAKIIYGFWPGWSSQRITDVSLNYTAIGLFNFHNSGNGLDNGSASWPWPGNPSPAEVATVRARGQKIFIVVGGVTNTFFYQTRQQSTNLLNSLTSFINSLGGTLDGVDFNTWNSDITGLDYATELIYMAQQLKAQYGQNFVITFPVKNDLLYNLTLMRALSDAGCLSWANPQYTDNAAFKTAGAVSGSITGKWLAPPKQLPPTQLLIGLSSNYSYTNSLTLAECTREWDTAYAAAPTLRGVGCYNTESDGQVSFAFANMFKSKFDAAGQSAGASLTNNNTAQVGIYGTQAQVNAALNGLIYTPTTNYVGADTLQMVTSDGTFTDTDSLPITIT